MKGTNMYYVWREDNTVLADIGSGAQQSFVPYGTRPAAYFSLQAASLKTVPQPGKPRAFAIAFGELPPNAADQRPAPEKDSQRSQ
jgi:hypothetical protein